MTLGAHIVEIVEDLDFGGNNATWREETFVSDDESTMKAGWEIGDL